MDDNETAHAAPQRRAGAEQNQDGRVAGSKAEPPRCCVVGHLKPTSLAAVAVSSGGQEPRPEEPEKHRKHKKNHKKGSQGSPFSSPMHQLDDEGVE